MKSLENKEFCVCFFNISSVLTFLKQIEFVRIVGFSEDILWKTHYIYQNQPNMFLDNLRFFILEPVISWM